MVSIQPMPSFQQLSQPIPTQMETSLGSFKLGWSKGMPDASDCNYLILYNIATLSYQTQSYGKALSYLNEIIKNLELVEEFLQIKTLFLALQILFELRLISPAQPIITYLEAKLPEIEHISSEKQLRNAPSESSKEESKKQQHEGMNMNKNFLCIIAGSYIRKHGISPKNANVFEYKFLMHSYKALFSMLQGEMHAAG